MKPVLHIGNCNYSSWSLRPWLCLKWAGVKFEERHIDLDQTGYGEDNIAAVREVSPTGKVPVLIADGHRIWDSLAIAEWAAEQTGAALWPAEWKMRALARSLAAEMHAGFATLRNELPMNIRRRCRAFDLAPATLRDIARVDAIWSNRMGDYLCGTRSIADAFYVPIATRFRTYGIELSPLAEAYCGLLLREPAFVAWEQMALAEPGRHFQRAPIDSLYS